VAGNKRLARSASLTATAAVSVSPGLLILDLGRRERFLNMLRVFKVTSPMSVGSWLLMVSGAADTVAAASEVTGRARRTGIAAQATSAALGPALCTYTAVLIADTAVPVWHDARYELPAVFAGSAAASAGAAAIVLTPAAAAGPARRLLVLGVLSQSAALAAMEHRLGAVGEVYRKGRAGRYRRAAQALIATGTPLAAAGTRWRLLSRAGAVMVLAGCVCERFSVFEAGRQSALDPAATVEPQRARVAAGEGASVRQDAPDGAGRRLAAAVAARLRRPSP
jgi:hypothetical protein